MKDKQLTKHEEARIRAAADKLYAIGMIHSWWGKSAKPSLSELDPLGREEFLDITWAVVKAYIDG